MCFLSLNWREKPEERSSPSKMVSRGTLISCFSNLGCDASDKSVIDRCVKLCNEYNLDEEIFVETWIAYTVSRFLSIDPTVDELNKLEEEELKKNKEVSVETVVDAISNTHINLEEEEEEDITNNVLDMYSNGQPSTQRQIKRERSPGIETGNESKIRAVDITFTPATYNATQSTPSRAPSTIVRGKVLLSFGPRVTTWKKRAEHDVSISKSDNPHVPRDVVYMYEMLSKQGAGLSSNCESFGERLCHIWNETGGANPNVRYVRNVLSVSQVAFRTWGRISTTLDKSASSKVIILEGCKRSKGENNAPIVRLDLGRIRHYSVFPGQIVAVEGTNTTGNSLIVKELFLKGHAPLVDTPKLSNDLRICVAVGPFTLSDNLNYQPLWDLMERVAEEEPDVLILVGPFLDYSHSDIKKCILKDTFHDFFDQILGRILQSLQGKSTRVVLVSSNRDAHHEPVYPTPEYTIIQNKMGSNVGNLHAMPDPCILNIDGLHVGVTSVDTIRHLSQKEMSNISGMDRIGRLADHVLSQATFYPLYPPLPGLNFDTTLWQKYACFERQPHVMILPSDIRYYCKVINESLVLNPERLQKYIYAKLLVRPASGGKWNPNDVSCEIARV